MEKKIKKYKVKLNDNNKIEELTARLAALEANKAE